MRRTLSELEHPEERTSKLLKKLKCYYVKRWKLHFKCMLIVLHIMITSIPKGSLENVSPESRPAIMCPTENLIILDFQFVVKCILFNVLNNKKM